MPSPNEASKMKTLLLASGVLLVSHDDEKSNKSDDEGQVQNTERAEPREKDPLDRTRLPKQLPTILEIKKALPQHCFESNTLLSIYFMLKDFTLVVILYFMCEWTWKVLPLSAQFVITPVFWLLQGTMFTALFTTGHDAGHGSFSKYELVNTICGNICHTFLFCPYYMWKVSHQKHHKNTANIDKDEVFYPVRKRDHKPAPLLPGFGLATGWYFYLLRGYRPRGVHHFNPLEPMFQYHVTNCGISLASIVAWAMALAYFKDTFGWGALFYHYMVPDIIFASYTVIITFLHHTEDGVPWYGDRVWGNVRGQLSTVDRSYGWCHYLIHNIGTHQIHHLFPKVPHYHLEEATALFRKTFPELVNVSHERILPAFARMFRKYAAQNIVADDADVHLWK